MNLKLIGPFKQVVTMDHLPLKGSISDSQLEIIHDGGIVIADELIVETGHFGQLKQKYSSGRIQVLEISGDWVVFPGMIDAHTHICFAGSRANDFALRLAGLSYLEISQQGGGIWNTVTQTRQETFENLVQLTAGRAHQAILNGVTTMEVKSGYSLDVQGEIRLLKVIAKTDKIVSADLISTCLAAHTLPKDFSGSKSEYLRMLTSELLPQVKAEKLSNRIDIFVEKSAFSVEEAKEYLQKAKEMGFRLTVHADQFTRGASALACQIGAASADHLEVSGEEEITELANSDTVSVCLPGSSIGLGEPFAPARKLLDSGACVAIASDWNPGSAPMGKLLLQACILGLAQKLSTAEIWAAVTFRAAHALQLTDRGRLKNGMLADFIAFPVTDYREVLYQQGSLVPGKIWKKGIEIQI